jgi:hypothetical protein
MMAQAPVTALHWWIESMMAPSSPSWSECAFRPKDADPPDSVGADATTRIRRETAAQVFVRGVFSLSKWLQAMPMIT